MSENLRTFTQAVYAFDAVVQRTAGDQWGNDTPCDGWDARQLLEHQCAVLNGVQRIAETGAMARPTPPASMDDPQAVWADTRDRLLRSLIEEHAGPAQLIAAGEDPQTVEQIWRLLKRSEFKRRQAAPVLKLSEQAFGSGWRMPIAAGTGITAAKSPR